MNSHSKIALFMAPFLLIGGFFAADFYMQSEQGDQARRLIAEAGCRLREDACRLRGGDLRIDLRSDRELQAGRLVRLGLLSNLPLQGVSVGIADEQDRQGPARQMQQVGDPNHWLIELAPNLQPHRLRLALSFMGEFYFAEVVLSAER